MRGLRVLLLALFGMLGWSSTAAAVPDSFSYDSHNVAGVQVHEYESADTASARLSGPHEGFAAVSVEDRDGRVRYRATPDYTPRSLRRDVTARSQVPFR